MYDSSHPRATRHFLRVVLVTVATSIAVVPESSLPCSFSIQRRACKHKPVRRVSVVTPGCCGGLTPFSKCLTGVNSHTSRRELSNCPLAGPGQLLCQTGTYREGVDVHFRSAVLRSECIRSLCISRLLLLHATGKRGNTGSARVSKSVTRGAIQAYRTDHTTSTERQGFPL